MNFFRLPIYAIISILFLQLQAMEQASLSTVAQSRKEMIEALSDYEKVAENNKECADYASTSIEKLEIALAKLQSHRQKVQESTLPENEKMAYQYEIALIEQKGSRTHYNLRTPKQDTITKSRSAGDITQLAKLIQSEFKTSKCNEKYLSIPAFPLSNSRPYILPVAQKISPNDIMFKHYGIPKNYSGEHLFSED